MADLLPKEWSVVRRDDLSAAHQQLWSRSPTSPKIVLYVQSVSKTNVFTMDFGLERFGNPNSELIIKEVTVDFEQIKKFDAALVQYFRGTKVHDYFPPKKPVKGAPPLREQVQKYFDELLKIPGICIFSEFTSLFQVDATMFAQPPAA
jgi:hypothetical protein